MSCGVAVAAEQGHARQREALFRANDVDDALTLIHQVEQFDAKLVVVLVGLFHYHSSDRVINSLVARMRRDDMIHHAQHLVRAAHLQTSHAQPLKSLRLHLHN